MGNSLTRRSLLAAGLAGGLLSLDGRAARAARGTEIFPAPGSLVFAVRRRGETVGSHRFDFSDGPGYFTARYHSEFAFALKNGRAWRYRNYGEEVWRDGWLDSLVSDTLRGGKAHKLRLKREGEALYGKVDSLGISVSGYVITTSLWHRDTPFTQVLLGHEDGLTKVVNAVRLGSETVEAPEGPVTAKRYALSGEIERNLWYGSGARLLKASWPDPEGEILSLRLEEEIEL
jgi:hypothetical protein